MAAKVDIALDSRSKLGEGAIWDVADERLWWVDIKSHLIHRFDPSTGQNDSFDFGEPVSCIVRRDAGGLVVASEGGLHLFDPQNGSRETLHQPEKGLAGNRFNDGTPDPAGRLWAGTMQDDGTPQEVRRGQYYRLDADHGLTTHFDKVFTTNGLAFSPDGKTMYFADTNKTVQTIWSCSYDPATGTPGTPEVFFDSREVAGRPDGATVDADGCYWMAGVGGWQVVRITPQGKVDQVIDVPVEKPSKPMFGGAGLDTLFVTSIGIGSENDPDQPHAGSLLAITGLGTHGLPQPRYAG